MPVGIDGSVEHCRGLAVEINNDKGEQEATLAWRRRCRYSAGPIGVQRFVLVAQIAVLWKTLGCTLVM